MSYFHAVVVDIGCPAPFPEISPISVSLGGITNLLHNLNPHKATGPDEIPA